MTKNPDDPDTTRFGGEDHLSDDRATELTAILNADTHDLGTALHGDDDDGVDLATNNRRPPPRDSTLPAPHQKTPVGDYLERLVLGGDSGSTSMRGPALPPQAFHFDSGDVPPENPNPQASHDQEFTDPAKLIP